MRRVACPRCGRLAVELIHHFERSGPRLKLWPVYELAPHECEKAVA